MTNYRRRRTQPKDAGKRYNINEALIGKEFRVLDEEGAMLGIMSRKDALTMAETKELDLIEINPKAEPPVVKLMDFYKFKYQQSKSDAAKKIKKEETKTIRVSVRVSINDLNVRANKIKEFLGKSYKVKMQVQMKGREKAHPEVAVETMKTFISLLDSEIYSFESEPKLVGDSTFATIKPKKVG
ncbi:MAG: translation initiation factor IF-3 [candidate division SR1 bacterium]|nr:translation initiation factor IF-3 [candidate division SR1 bacterium]